LGTGRVEDMEREELDENNVRKAMRVLDGCGGAK